ncbi:MAG: hypothetical protein ACFE9T_06235 [Promethearchaeota archaeon]
MEQKKIFNCDLEDSTLRECIYAELKDSKIKFYTDKPQNIIDKEVLNCLDSGLVACIRDEAVDRVYLSPIAEITAHLNEENTWLIESVNISVNLKTTDKELLKKINNCLIVFKFSCKVPETINFYVIDKIEFDTLQNYKMKIEELTKELNKIKGQKIKKEDLYNLFKVPST